MHQFHVDFVPLLVRVEPIVQKHHLNAAQIYQHVHEARPLDFGWLLRGAFDFLYLRRRSAPAQR